MLCGAGKYAIGGKGSQCQMCPGTVQSYVARKWGSCSRDVSLGLAVKLACLLWCCRWEIRLHRWSRYFVVQWRVQSWVLLPSGLVDADSCAVWTGDLQCPGRLYVHSMSRLLPVLATIGHEPISLCVVCPRLRKWSIRLLVQH
jgi:hypothetical protein